MATVTMDINELDTLRTELKKAQKSLKDKEQEINDVKTDKRVIVRTERQNLEYIELDEYQVRELFEKYKRERINNGYSKYSNYYRYRVMVPNKYTKNPTLPTQFINFEDVKEELKDQLAKDYAKEIVELKGVKKSLNDAIATVRQEAMQEENKLKKEFNSQKENLLDSIKEWEKKYTELESGKKEQSKIEELESMIEELTEALQRETSKKWWQKL